MMLMLCRWSGRCLLSTVRGWGRWPVWWCWSSSPSTTPPVSSPTTGLPSGQRTPCCWMWIRETPPLTMIRTCTISPSTGSSAQYRVCTTAVLFSQITSVVKANVCTFDRLWNLTCVFLRQGSLSFCTPSSFPSEWWPQQEGFIIKCSGKFSVHQWRFLTQLQ